MLGSMDPAGGPFEPLTFCPGYLRGLAFWGPGGCNRAPASRAPAGGEDKGKGYKGSETVRAA
jgi:hypothetical protein